MRRGNLGSPRGRGEKDRRPPRPWLGRRGAASAPSSCRWPSAASDPRLRCPGHGDASGRLSSLPEFIASTKRSRSAGPVEGIWPIHGAPRASCDARASPAKRRLHALPQIPTPSPNNSRRSSGSPPRFSARCSGVWSGDSAPLGGLRRASAAAGLAVPSRVPRPEEERSPGPTAPTRRVARSSSGDDERSRPSPDRA